MEALDKEVSGSFTSVPPNTTKRSGDYAPAAAPPPPTSDSNILPIREASSSPAACAFHVGGHPVSLDVDVLMPAVGALVTALTFPDKEKLLETVVGACSGGSGGYCSTSVETELDSAFQSSGRLSIQVLTRAIGLVAAAAVFPAFYTYFELHDGDVPSNEAIQRATLRSKFNTYRVGLLQAAIAWLCYILQHHAATMSARRRAMYCDLSLCCVSTRWEWVVEACSATVEIVAMQHMSHGGTLARGTHLLDSCDVIRTRLHAVCFEQHERLLELVLTIVSSSSTSAEPHEPFSTLDDFVSELSQFDSSDPTGLSRTSPDQESPTIISSKELMHLWFETCTRLADISSCASSTEISLQSRLLGYILKGSAFHAGETPFPIHASSSLMFAKTLTGVSSQKNDTLGCSAQVGESSLHTAETVLPQVIVAAPGTDNIHCAISDTVVTTEMASFEPLAVSVVGGGRFVAVIANQPQYTRQSDTQEEATLRQLSVVCLYDATHLDSPPAGRFHSKAPVAVLPLAVDRNMVRLSKITRSEPSSSQQRSRSHSGARNASAAEDGESGGSDDDWATCNSAIKGSCMQQEHNPYDSLEVVASCCDLTPTLTQGVCLGNGSYERDHADVAAVEIDCNAPGGFTACIADAPSCPGQDQLLIMVGAGPFLVWEEEVGVQGGLRAPSAFRGHLPAKVAFFNLTPLVRRLELLSNEVESAVFMRPVVLLPSTLHRPHRAADGSFDLVRPKHDVSAAAAASQRARVSLSGNVGHFDLADITASNERRFQHRLHRFGHQRYFLGAIGRGPSSDADSPHWVRTVSKLLSRGRTSSSGRGGKRRRVETDQSARRLRLSQYDGRDPPLDAGQHPFLNLFPPEVLRPSDLYNASSSSVATRQVRSEEEAAAFRGMSRELERPRLLKGVAARLQDLHEQHSAKQRGRSRAARVLVDDLPFCFPLAIDAMAWVVDGSLTTTSPSPSWANTEWQSVDQRIYHRGVDPAVLALEASLIHQMSHHPPNHPTSLTLPLFSSLQVVSCSGNELLRWLPFTGALLQRIVLPYSIRAVNWSQTHNSIIALDATTTSPC